MRCRARSGCSPGAGPAGWTGWAGRPDVGTRLVTQAGRGTGRLPTTPPDVRGARAVPGPRGARGARGPRGGRARPRPSTRDDPCRGDCSCGRLPPVTSAARPELAGDGAPAGARHARQGAVHDAGGRLSTGVAPGGDVQGGKASTADGRTAPPLGWALPGSRRQPRRRSWWPLPSGWRRWPWPRSQLPAILPRSVVRNANGHRDFLSRFSEVRPPAAQARGRCLLLSPAGRLFRWKGPTPHAPRRPMRVASSGARYGDRSSAGETDVLGQRGQPTPWEGVPSWASRSWLSGQWSSSISSW